MIRIMLPYDDAEEKCYVWANEEEKIDFRRDGYRAARCTLSFAATELLTYLQRLGFDAELGDGECERKICISACEGDAQSFSFTVDGNCINIHGDGRCGALYGVYELLETQGIRWYSPWEEFIPKNVLELVLPCEGHYAPDMWLGRGFDFEGPLKESRLLYLWMARNKLNLSTVRPNTKQFQRKLGMSFKIGGHIFDKIIDPKQKLISGKTMFEEHPDWYGTTDEPLTEENALFRQFCVSNSELCEYLWQSIFCKLKNEWYEADRIDVWGLDTWGKICQCERCKGLGNGSDHILHFLSYLRKRLDAAVADGELDHNVRMVMCSYEGTATIEPPIGGMPENLRKSGDYTVFYPILRCYEHRMDDPKCAYNSHYQGLIERWSGIPMMIGEYYNVSKFQELPLLFTRTMQDDLVNYHKNGFGGITYMHLPMLEWGVRALTQLMYAKLAWNLRCDTHDISKKYFDDLYGELSPLARKMYALIEESGRLCASWRSWGEESMLTVLLKWDGEAAERYLYQDDHLDGDAVDIGLESARFLESALDIAREMRIMADELHAKDYEPIPMIGVAVNPNDARFLKNRNFLGERISQDIRSLIYGIDVTLLTTYFVKYQRDLADGLDTAELWGKIRELALKMESYCYSVKYSHTEPELTHSDALDRSGLRDLYSRCYAARIRKGMC